MCNTANFWYNLNFYLPDEVTRCTIGKSWWRIQRCPLCLRGFLIRLKAKHILRMSQKGRCHKTLFISHHGQTLIWRKSSTTGQWLLAIGRNQNEELGATSFEMSNVMFVWISWLSTDVERITFVCPAWSNPGFINSTWIHQPNPDIKTYKTTTNPAKTSWYQWC